MIFGSRADADAGRELEHRQLDEDAVVALPTYNLAVAKAHDRMDEHGAREHGACVATTNMSAGRGVAATRFGLPHGMEQISRCSASVWITVIAIEMLR